MLATKLVSICQNLTDFVKAGEECILLRVEKSIESHLLKLHLQLSTRLFAGVIENNMTLLGQGLSHLKADGRLATTGQTSQHAAGRRPDTVTREQGIHILPTSLHHSAESIRHLDVSEPSRKNLRTQSARRVGRRRLNRLARRRRLLHTPRIPPGAVILNLILFLFKTSGYPAFYCAAVAWPIDRTGQQVLFLWGSK